MPVVVNIEKNILTVKDEWVEDLDSAENYNQGILLSASDKKKIFYSADKEKDPPNFKEAKLCYHFDRNKDAVYSGFVLKYFG